MDFLHQYVAENSEYQHEEEKLSSNPKFTELQEVINAFCETYKDGEFLIRLVIFVLPENS